MIRLRELYRNFFSIEEIEKSQTLQMVFYALMIGFFYSIQDLFFRDVGLSGFTGASSLCPDYFQSCHRLYVFPSRFESWSYPLFCTLLYSMIGGAIVSAVCKKWTRAHFLILFPFFIKFFANTFLTSSISVPFETDHLFPCFIFLFARKKEDNLRLIMIFLYILSGIVKLHPAWIAGTYFSSQVMGLPLFPDSLIPVITNFVILFELVLVWLLFSKKQINKKVVFYFFILFHIYSAIYVGFRYPLLILPLFLILFNK